VSGAVAIASGQVAPSPELAESRELNSKVLKLYSEAKYDEALPLAKRALELREKALGPAHEELVPLLTNLGELYKVKKQPGQARSYFERALTIQEKTLGENDIRVAQLLDKLGYVAWEQGERKDAEKFFMRSLQIKELARGPDHPDTAKTIFNLAEIYRFRGDYHKAEPLYERVVSIYEKAPGKDDSDLNRALEAYIATLVALKKPTDEVQQKLNQLMTGKRAVQLGVLNGKALKLIQPEYPMVARIDHASGIVRVKVVIGENGKVISATGINQENIHRALVAAAEDAARRSLFTPTYVSGVPVKVTGIIIYRFVAQ
jgi:TonB family protein